MEERNDEFVVVVDVGDEAIAIFVCLGIWDQELLPSVYNCTVQSATVRVNPFCSQER